MSVRALIRCSLALLVAAILAAPLALQQGYSDGPCPIGTQPVVNTDECAVGPGGNIVRNKVGKLMDIGKCATYKGREYDEMDYHRATSPASTAAAAFDTSQDRAVGPTSNIWQMVDDGSIVFQDPAGTRIDTVDVVKKFLTRNSDQFDYVAIWPNFNHAEGSFHNHIKNDVRGINVPIQNNSATYGSQFMKSLVLYRNFNGFPSDPYARIPGNNDSTMSLMAQESGHRVAAWVRRDKDPTQRIRVSTDLLGRNEAHWCFYLNGPSVTTSIDPNRPGFSSMEGNSWRDNGDGTHTTALKSDGYSRLDQYLWGFRPPGVVGSFFRLDPGNGKPNPDCSHAPFTPGVDTPWTFSYPKINVVVDDIIRVEGNRNPDSQTSQKNWRMAFILLAQQGTQPTTGEINKLDNYRLRWEEYFRDEAGGGRMFTALGPVDMDSDTYFSNTDCDDNDPAVHPNATEVCNSVDDDCDGLIDDGFDADGDLYTTCNFDCDDADPTRNPGATEVVNGKDDDCDGLVDNIPIDADNDGYYLTRANPADADCNDANAAINPGAVERVNGFDDNCNGYVDCLDPNVVTESDSGPRGNDGFDNDCNGVIDG